MLALLTILLLLVGLAPPSSLLLVAAEPALLCSSPPRSIYAPSHAVSAVYFLFVVDNSWPEHKIAQQKALFEMIACEIPRSSAFRVGTIYAYAPKRPKDFAFDEKALAPADRFASTLDDTIERSYSPRAHDRSRCSRMHRVLEVMRLADFSYDDSVHTHYIFPTDDSEDDFVNDCDPAWTFKQSARNIVKEATPNHLYLDVIRIGAAHRWTQYGERVQLADWSDRSINQKDVSHLFASFLDGALRGDAVNDVIVFATNGLERSERPQGLKSLVNDAPPPLSSLTSSTPTTTTVTTTAVSTTTTGASDPPPVVIPSGPAAVLPRKGGRRKSFPEDDDRVRSVLVGNRTEAAEAVPYSQGAKSPKYRRGVNETAPIETTTDAPTPVEEKHVVFGYQTPFSSTVFYIIVVATTVAVVVLVWIMCGLVFCCCYRDDDSLKKHNAKEDEDEEEPMLISGLHDNDWERPSSMMISDHLRKVKEDRYNEEQLRSSESRGTITVEV